MTKTEIEDYFKKGAVASAYESAPSAPNLQWIPQVSPEAQLERNALAYGLDNRPPAPPQAVAKEPAATAAVYQQTPQAYADQSRMQQLQMGVPALVTPAVDYPMGPTIEVTEMLGVEDPQNGGPDQGGYANKVRLPENPNAWAGAPGGTVVRDSFGNAVLSGTGQAIGLPTQNPNYKAPAGGGKGADATVDSAIKQIGGK